MKAVVYREFGGEPRVETLPDPVPEPDGVVIGVRATGLCRSDWHGWQGRDPDIRLPHVPGHELAGLVEAVGGQVRHWRAGDRVTVPFCCGCGSCAQCRAGNEHICDRHFQPGFTHWGAFAERVAIRYADVNLVRLPETMGFVAAASLGCRFVTAFRALRDVAQVSAGEWVAVHGCGGVGASAVMIATALGAHVIAIDIHDNALALARRVGAEVLINASSGNDVVAAVVSASGGGVHVSVDALGSAVTCRHSILACRKRGRHVQVGLLHVAGGTPLPMEVVIARELEILGSHGMQAHRYAALFEMIAAGTLAPQALVSGTIALADVPAALMSMDDFSRAGIVVADRFC